MQKTYFPKADELNSEWVVVNAQELTLGRLASKVAAVLLGKHKPSFTPGVFVGDFVVVVNADAFVTTGKKMTDKFYYHHSGYPGGIKSISLKKQLAEHPDRVIRAAVWGMLPHNKFGRKLIKRLKIYTKAEHPHEAQQPKPMG